MSLTNLLLFLILVTLATYTFMPWKGIDKGPRIKLFIQFIIWTLIFAILVFVVTSLGLVI